MILPAENCRFGMQQGDMTYHPCSLLMGGKCMAVWPTRGWFQMFFLFLFYFFLSFFGEIFMGFFLMNLCFFSKTQMQSWDFVTANCNGNRREKSKRGLYNTWRVRLVFKLIRIKLMRKFMFYFLSSFYFAGSSSYFLLFFLFFYFLCKK